MAPNMAETREGHLIIIWIYNKKEEEEREKAYTQ